MITKETILYIRDNTGSLRVWAISSSGHMMTIRYGQVGGSMQYKTEVVREGKATRTVGEQMMSRMASRISKQRDKGYVNSQLQALENKATNALGLPKPMLAQKIQDVKNIDYSIAVIQPKFDGNRCIICKNGGVTYGYTRNGKLIYSIKHIFDDIELDEGMYVDGELYAHGESLQTIVSWVKREQENTLKLKYHMYDVVSPLPYIERSDLLRGIPIGDSISLVTGAPIDSYDVIPAYFRSYREQGYEGAILRWGNSGYEDGKRSKSLVKIKRIEAEGYEEKEFRVIDVHASKDGWAILECFIPTWQSTTFRVSAPGTIEEKIEILNQAFHYLGKYVTVEFANYTEDGVPFHPVAIRFREDV